KSQLLFFLKQLPEAIEAARTAIALNPNTAHGYYSMALAEIWLGRCEQAIGHIRQAFGLSPRDPLGGLWHMYLGVSEACLGRLDIGVGEINRAIDVGYRTYYAYAFLTAVEAAKGNEAAAKNCFGGGASSQSAIHDQVVCGG